MSREGVPTQFVSAEVGVRSGNLCNYRIKEFEPQARKITDKSQTFSWRGWGVRYSRRSA